MNAELWKQSSGAQRRDCGTGVEQKVAAENVLNGALRQLFALSENYPI